MNLDEDKIAFNKYFWSHITLYLPETSQYFRLQKCFIDLQQIKE